MRLRHHNGSPVHLSYCSNVHPADDLEGVLAQLDRYVDLELAGADADAAIPGLRAHLEGCPACREDHESLLEYARSERS